MGVVIQEMSIQDYDEVRAVWEASEGIQVSDIDSRESIDRFLKRNAGLSFVARENDQLVGAVLCGHDGRRGYIDHLAVRSSHRRQGIGRSLASRCLFHLMRIGIRRWNLFVLEDNKDARSFWTHLERGGVIHDDDWAVIVFYRPPGCVRPGFNLLDFFDVAAVFDCQPPTTDGFEIWKNGPPPIDDAPIHTSLHGRGAVPVWFVSWADLQSAIGDDFVTITEIASLQSRLTGEATYFHETLHPTGGANNSKINFVASGSLDSGGSFRVHASANSVSGHSHMDISLGD